MATCKDCDSEYGMDYHVWTAGGRSVSHYEEWITKKWLCEKCAEYYTVCEECGVLIDDNVSLPKGAILCPDCRPPF